MHALYYGERKLSEMTTALADWASQSLARVVSVSDCVSLPIFGQEHLQYTDELEQPVYRSRKFQKICGDETTFVIMRLVRNVLEILHSLDDTFRYL